MLRGTACVLALWGLLVAAPVVAAERDARRTGPVFDYSGKALAAAFHYYIDDGGRYHFTNRPDLVPPRYRVVPLTLFVSPPGRSSR